MATGLALTGWAAVAEVVLTAGWALEAGAVVTGWGTATALEAAGTSLVVVAVGVLTLLAATGWAVAIGVAVATGWAVVVMAIG